MFRDEIKRLEKLNGKEILIYARGEYPVKAKTKVQAVAHYQNDGTAKIKPARFIETAEERAGGWRGFIIKAVENIIAGSDMRELGKIGKIIAKDISIAVNRIRTGRLKRSITYRIR